MEPKPNAIYIGFGKDELPARKSGARGRFIEDDPAKVRQHCHHALPVNTASDAKQYSDGHYVICRRISNKHAHAMLVTVLGDGQTPFNARTDAGLPWSVLSLH